MKKIVSLLFVCSLGSISFAQQSAGKEEKPEVKKEVKKSETKEVKKVPQKKTTEKKGK